MVEVIVEATGLVHPEGPAALDDGLIVFVETFREQVSRWRPGGPVSLFAMTGGGPNACCAGTDGVYVTQIGPRIGDWVAARPAPTSIQRIERNGAVTAVVTAVGGRALTAPNDLCFGPRGNLVFTDPGNFSLTRPEDGYVFSVNANGTTDFVIEVGKTFPNGLLCLPDDSVVWVESYTRRIMRHFADGAIRHVATLPEGHMPDGLKAGSDGRLYIASIRSGGVDAVSLETGAQEFIRTGGRPLNCLFVGSDLIVACDGDEMPGHKGPAPTGRLLRLKLGVTGLPLYRGSVAAQNSLAKTAIEAAGRGSAHAG
jgi:gluconolactonase